MYKDESEMLEALESAFEDLYDSDHKDPMLVYCHIQGFVIIPDDAIAVGVDYIADLEDVAVAVSNPDNEFDFAAIAEHFAKNWTLWDTVRATNEPMNPTWDETSRWTDPTMFGGG